MRIEGPLCTFSFCGDVEFQVLSVDGSTEVGKISKQWSGILREVGSFTVLHRFSYSYMGRGVIPPSKKWPPKDPRLT